MKVRFALAGALVLAALAPLAAAAPALAQAASPTDPGWPSNCAFTGGKWVCTPRDGRMEQAVADTLGVTMRRAGVSAEKQQSTLDQIFDFLKREAAKTAGCYQRPSGTTVHTWMVIINCTTGIPMPFGLGRPGQPLPGGGMSGGGGATGSWDPQKPDCSNLKWKLDAAGNLIIPSYVLQPGKPVTVATAPAPAKGQAYASTLVDSSVQGPDYYMRNVTGDQMESMARRYVHLKNMKRATVDWFGIVGPRTDMPGCVAVATVAFRGTNGVVTQRQSENVCHTATTHDKTTTYEQGYDPKTMEHKNCPEDPNQGSSDFHFYGYGDSTVHPMHIHGCVHYFPRPDFGWAGYAINPETTLLTANFSALPEWLKACGLDPAMLAKIAEGLWREAAREPGYTGEPPRPVPPGDSRPGDTGVGDLPDEPGTGTTPPKPNPEVPPPTEPPGGGTNPPPTTGYKDECDFGGEVGAGGCTDPGIAEPEVGEAPTDFFNGIKDWMPDLPSITIPTTGAADCPTWDVDATSFAEGWQWRLDAHCDLAEKIRGILSALMVLVWGIYAATKILEA